VHIGHLVLAREAAEAMEIERVMFIPAFVSPFKCDRPPAPPEDRLEMVRLAVAEEPLFECSDIEIARGGPSFAIDTVREVRSALPDAQMHFFIGFDNVGDLGDWRESDALRELVQFVVLAREVDQAVSDLPVISRRIEISSTEIRNRVACGKSIRYLVPENVSRFIESRGLYRNG